MQQLADSHTPVQIAPPGGITGPRVMLMRQDARY
jgi:hypothetical protein